MAAGGSVALCGFLLFLYERASSASAQEARIWMLMRWLHMRLPTPDDPRLITPTLALLNTPVWLALAVLGSLVAAAFWIVRAIE